ncbi:MAG: hypothetical protein GXY03_02155, partial [Solirubrobacterales bacterium]|nr:hypothetical protein [Solirubrobacterales bacterium]
SARWFLERSMLAFADRPECDARPIAVGRTMPELQNDVVDWLFHYGLAAGPTYYRNPYLPDCELDFEVGVDADQLTRPFDPGPRAEGLAPFQGFYLDLEDEHRAGPPTDDATIDVPVYAERTDEGDGGVRLTYWMLFGMHAPEGRPVRVHEGDWERVDVLLDDLGEDRYVPHTVEVGPAPIERRVRVPWSSARRADGSHPIVQLARGSHTPLASHDRDCAGCLAWPTWQTLSNAPDEVWYGFGGAWGEVGASDATTGPLGPHRHFPRLNHQDRAPEQPEQ